MSHDSASSPQIVRGLKSWPPLNRTEDSFKRRQSLRYLGLGLIRALELKSFQYLGVFKSGFRPGFVTEAFLVTLMDNPYWEKDGWSVALLILDFFVAFSSIYYRIWIGWSGGWYAIPLWFWCYLVDQLQKVGFVFWRSLRIQYCLSCCSSCTGNFGCSYRKTKVAAVHWWHQHSVLLLFIWVLVDPDLKWEVVAAMACSIFHLPRQL